ncbi:MAG: hypothetical protein Q8L11_03255 [Candidatus Moranbacteria bacterium]|nr:hypothetical protein [Candidatus Moranbacteria bacterium]
MQQLIKNKNISRIAAYLWLVLGEMSTLAAIIAVGWFLIGYYAHFEFLQTGYQDWIYHAFRVQDISQFGIASWDHIWSGGINHWRAFQYIEHMLTYGVVNLTGMSITHAMLWISIVVFIALRVFMYGVLRYLKISRLFSAVAVIVSFAFSQQWTALKEFSIFVGFIVVPLYVLLWIATLKSMRYVFLLAAITGASWSIHPVVGYSMSGMLLFLVLANNLKKDIRKLMLVVLVYFVSSMPFTIPYFFSGYSVSNLFYVTPQFLRMLLVPEYFGLSLLYFILLAVSWVIMVVKSSESPRWAKILLLYCTVYLCFIYFGLLGYFPVFINKFQFSRAIPFIALVLPFCFAAFFQTALPNIRSRMAYAIFIVLIAIGISQSIEIATRYSGQPIDSIQDPVAIYFANKEVPYGSIYFKDVTEASYLGKTGLRFITSYNQHLLPNPYSMRFDGLMKTDISYTGVTERQIKMINDYSLVLGVEYVFIPKLSPLVNGLTVSQGDFDALFENLGEVNVPSDVFAVLRNRQPIANAYAFDKNNMDNFLRFSEIPKPTLQIDSYKLWDDEISRMAQLIRSGQMKSLPMSFVWPNKLVVDAKEIQDMNQPSLLLTQSYDQNWTIENEKSAIKPTNLRFMSVNLPKEKISDKVVLSNNWPRWHWPIQSLGLVMIVVTGIIAIFRRHKIINSTNRTNL